MISRSITSILALVVLSFSSGNEMNIYRYNRPVFALHRLDGPKRTAQRRVFVCDKVHHKVHRPTLDPLLFVKYLFVVSAI